MSFTHFLTLPLKNKKVLKQINIGDSVYLSGFLVTARDRAHHFFTHHLKEATPLIQKLKPYLEKGGIYHCGPIVNLENKQILSAGPTTSMREEPYQEQVIELFNLAAVIGKGGMGQKTQQAFNSNNSVYLNAIGGAGSYYAKNLKVKEVFMLSEFGMPEALWVLEVHDFFTLASMVPHQESLHQKVLLESKKNLDSFIL